MAGLHEVVTLCMELDESLLEVGEDPNSRRQLIQKHLESVDKSKCLIPDFQKDLDWLNVSEPLSLTNQLSGKLLVLDFFTYCCINCMHVLPDLEHLESKFKATDGVVIIGVHSAKFLNEKVTANILSAVLRYDIEHPVVNDSEANLWQKLEISCWPTFVLVGPQGQYLYALVGEGHREKLFEFVDVAVEHYQSQGQLKRTDLPLSLEKHRVAKSPLKFPGKVTVTEDGDVLVVADTGNHRVVLLDGKTGVVQTVIGGRERGLRDGDFSTARFSSPQGVAVWGNQIWVADTDNHLIREIDLQTKTVRTVVGTGSQGSDKEGGQICTQQEISSPWDLALGWVEGDTSPSVLYIAMAGTHQIWVYFLQDTKWYKGSEHKAGICIRFAGSGNEENRNNSYPAKAGFAQPSGLAISPRNKLNTLYIADAESSSVRMIALKDGAVKALVGAERDPTNLFAYGDKDGVGVAAKLQHPLGVALASDEGPLLVADSYNHKIKSIDLTLKECTTLIGTSDKGRQLDEPGGLCVDHKRKLVYIADTNNHALRVYDMESKALTQLPVIFETDIKSTNKSSADIATMVDFVQPALDIKAGGHLDLTLTLELDPKSHLNEDAPNAWKLSSQDENGHHIVAVNPSKGKLKPVPSQQLTRLHIPGTASSGSDLVFTFQLFVCGSDNTCRVKKISTLLPLSISPTADSVITADLTLRVPS